MRRFSTATSTAHAAPRPPPSRSCLFSCSSRSFCVRSTSFSTPICPSRPTPSPTASSRPRSTPASSRSRCASSLVRACSRPSCRAHFARSSSCYASRRRAAPTSVRRASSALSDAFSASTRAFSASTFSADFARPSFSACRISTSLARRRAASSFSANAFYASPHPSAATFARLCSSSRLRFRNSTSCAYCSFSVCSISTFFYASRPPPTPTPSNSRSRFRLVISPFSASH